MRKPREWTEQEKRMVREGIIFLIGIWVMIIFYFILLENYLRDMLNLNLGTMSIFAGTRILLAASYVIVFLPGGVLAEFADSRVKKRHFRSRNVPIVLIFSGQFVAVAVALLTVFDTYFSEEPLLTQFPFAALCIGISLLVMAATFRMKMIRDYVKKAFD